MLTAAAPVDGAGLEEEAPPVELGEPVVTDADPLVEGTAEELGSTTGTVVLPAGAEGTGTTTGTVTEGTAGASDEGTTTEGTTTTEVSVATELEGAIGLLVYGREI